MVPTRLTLRNFMCYKNATLDLNGIHMACLSGDNGAGKSALLDAITWSLWGKARASDDEIIAQGEVEMQTDFEFTINQDVYRIVRTRTRKGGGHGEVTFSIKSPDSGWRPLNEATKTSTQKRITEVLRMEYETFINSAFLLQGRADEFTTKTPAERKRVLAEILGLEYFSDLEAKSKEEARSQAVIHTRLNDRLKELDEDLAKRPVYEHNRREAEEALLNGRAALARQEEDLNRLERLENALRHKDDQRQTALQRVAAEQAELDRLDRQIDQTASEIGKCQAVLARREQIEQGYNDYLATDKQHEALVKKFNRYGALLDQRRKLEDDIKRARLLLEADRRSAENALKEAAEQSRNLPALEKEAAELKNQLAQAEQQVEQLEARKGLRQEQQTRLGVLVEEGKRLERLQKEIEERGKNIPETGDRCDRCGTLMDADARDHILNERRAEYKECARHLQENKRQQAAARAELEKLDQAVKELEAPARRLVAWQKQAGALEQRLAQARQAGERAGQAQTELERLARRLEKEDFSPEQRRQLEQVNREAQELAYDDEARQQVKGRLDALKKYEQERNTLLNAEQRIGSLSSDLRRYQDRRFEVEQSRREHTELAAALALEVAGLAEITAQRAAAQDRKAEAQDEVNFRQRQVLEAELKLKRCDELAAERKLKAAEFDEAARLKSVYDELAVAFGKRGVQALIIETVLPELEDEANRLLGGMSDGRMSVRFETQGETKKGDPVEKLDLRISDETGIRSYELFSGGEAFRVNFAVRVALSKLLARRSGAALRTLVIDEGFGTQDGQGRERLVEAIRSIEDEFERVLIITHIHELKDVFPVRIDVVKTPDGSTISIN